MRLTQNKESEKEFFNKFASEKAYDVFDDRGYARLLKEFSLLVQPADGESFLDVGCGTGAFTAHLLEMRLRGVGVDIALNNVRMASTALSDTCFVVGDTELLPFPDNSFDIVTFSGILHHLPGLDRAPAEAFRVLKPGGRVFAYDPNGRNPAMWLYRSPRSPLSSRQGWTVNERLLLAEEVEANLSRAGFTNITAYGVSGITYKYVENLLVRNLLTLYNLLDLCLDKTGLGGRVGAFLISYGRKPID